MALLSVLWTAANGGVSDWADTGAGSDNNGGAPGQTNQGEFRSFITICNYWLVPGQTSVGSYPAQTSGSYTCHFSDGGNYGTGQGSVRYVCPPLRDRAANGRVDRYLILPDGTAKYAYYYCLYPTDEFAPVERAVGGGKVYTGGEAWFHSTGADGAAARRAELTGVQTDGTGYINRGVNLADPEPWIGSWEPAFTARTGVDAMGAPLYGYYRLLWKLDYRNCVKYAMPSWLGVPPRVDCSARGQDTSIDPFTYACDNAPPLQPGIRAGAIFDPARCVGNWVCSVTEEPLVAGHAADVTVMRNGEPVTVRIPSPTVTASTPSVRNVGSWMVRHTLAPDASPSKSFVSTSFTWDRWEPYRRDETVAFHWASEARSSFYFSTRYRFRAEWYVPVQDAPGAPVRYVWAPDITECMDVESQHVRVIRAVSSPGSS